MFGRYALPTDDVAPDATVTASAEETGYEAEYLVSANPSRPAKLSTTTGYWDLTFSSPVTIVAAALLYHNLDAGLADVELQELSGSPATIATFTIPTHHEDGWPVSPWVEFDPVTTSALRLDFNAANSLAITVGRLLLLTSIRDLGTDVRWGVEEQEEHGIIEQSTALGVETIYDLGGKRRRFVGDFGLIDTEATELISLYRSARSRILPWLLIPDVDVNDAWLVRFEDTGWSRTRQDPNFNTFPFRVRELSRGLPWP